MTPPADRLWDKKDLAAYLHIEDLKHPEKTVDYLLKHKRIPKGVYVGKRMRWSKQIIDEWFQFQLAAGK